MRVALRTAPGADTIRRSISRDSYRRDLVNGISTTFNDTDVDSLSYSYDALSRPTSRNEDTFAYNERGEVVFSRRDAESAEDTYAYDGIGNLQIAAFNSVTNTYAANSLNQYTSILRASAPLRETSHDVDGNMTSDGVFAYAYDAPNRLASVSLNGITLVANQYDYRGRRIRKTTSTAETTFVYDGWNLVYECEVSGETTNETFYCWGNDLSGTLQGAGGVGGLLYLKRNGAIYVPHADAYGNILRYTDTAGTVVAAYEYDAFGKTIAQTGPMAEVFRIRFSSKYFDSETGLYYYGYRFYAPALMRWLNRDPIEEDGGLNLYGFCGNNSILNIDVLGNERNEVPIDAYFSNTSMRKPYQMANYVKVYLKSLQKTGEKRYHYRVAFVARFTPPREVESRRHKQSKLSKFLFGDANVALGGEKGMFEPFPGVGDFPHEAWNSPSISSVPRRLGDGMAPSKRYNYQGKLFQFGYFVYRQRGHGGFKGIGFNYDMYVVWEVGSASRLLNGDDMSVEGDMGKCETVVVVYGDIGCKPKFITIKP